MPKPIPQERISVLRSYGVCKPFLDWYDAAPRNYEDLAAHPRWAFAAARLPGADVPALMAAVIASGDAVCRRAFAEQVEGLSSEDKAALLRGL